MTIKGRLEQGTLKSDFGWICTRNTAGNVKLFAKHSGACLFAQLVIEIVALSVLCACQLLVLMNEHRVKSAIVLGFLGACIFIPGVGSGIAQFLGLLVMMGIIAVPVGVAILGIAMGFSRVIEWYFDRPVKANKK